MRILFFKVANQGCEPVKNVSLLLGGNVMNAAER